MDSKALVRELLPVFVVQRVIPWLRLRLSKTGFGGDFGSWAEALASCGAPGGYEEPAIVADAIARNRASLNQMDGHVVETCQQVMAGMLPAVFAGRAGPVRVLDFGGGGGLYYYSIRQYLPAEIPLQWDVVETPAMASACGLAFQAPGLRFLSEIPRDAHDCALVSSVLQYVEHPHDVLLKIREVSTWVIINRIPLVRGRDRIGAQFRGRKLGGYPMWFLSDNDFTRFLETNFRIVMRWTSHQERVLYRGQVAPYQGFLLESRRG